MPASRQAGWDDDPYVSSWPGLPPLEDALTADACVVGLGASGLAAVEELTDRGLTVVGLDGGRVAAGASGRNGGLLLGGPAEYVHRSLETVGDDAIQLYKATLTELETLSQRLGPEVIRRTGSIRLIGLPGDPVDENETQDRDREAADCQAHAEAMRRHDIAVQDYEGPLGKGLFFPDDATMNPARRALELASRLRSHARLFENSPAHSITGGVVKTDSGAVTAPIIIVAVDGNLEQLLPQLAGRVRTARLQMLATAPCPRATLPYPVYCRWGYDYAQQAADGRLFVGGGRDRCPHEEWTTCTDPTTAVQSWIENIAQRIAGHPIDVTRRWAASVGFTTDGLPLCTQVEPGVFTCGGYCGTGNLVGVVAARAIAAYAVDGTRPPSYFSS